MPAAAVLIRLNVKPEHIEAFRGHTLALLNAALQEPGCQSIQLLQKPDDPTQFVMLEQWADRDYYLSDTHQKSAHLSAYFDSTKAMLTDVGVEMLAPVTVESVIDPI